jgi:hypothetical protein
MASSGPACIGLLGGFPEHHTWPNIHVNFKGLQHDLTGWLSAHSVPMSPTHGLTLLEGLGSPRLTDGPVVSHVGILLR